jgi:asparagine synthase (glutamine-hydrolysing)/putative beta-lactam synthetase
MSGFVGWVDFDRDLTARVPVVEAMTATMASRGPDGGGTWVTPRAALGLRRLRHGGPGAGGFLPAHLAVGGSELAAVMIGALDNREALAEAFVGVGAGAGLAPTGREAGRDGDDTQLVLAAYLALGIEAFARLDGSFAIALWDGRARALHLVRDRFGVRPLYYHSYASGCLFASEPKGIMANPLFEARLDLTMLPIVLQPRMAAAGETPLKNLHEVPPASVVSLCPEGLGQRRYWRLESAPHTDDAGTTTQTVRDLLARAVARQAPEEAKLAAMLSGGLDSTSVAALAVAARRVANGGGGDPLSTWCLAFEGDTRHFQASELRPDVDAPFAAMAARHLATRHTTLTASTEDLLAVLPATRRARDLPAWGQFDASMYRLFAAMCGSARLGLSGEAADEIFGGYPHFFKPELLARDGFPWAGDGVRLADYLAPDVARLCEPRTQEAERCRALLADVPGLAGEPAAEARMREVLYLGMAGPLSVILDRKDRMSMAHGLELRVPFLDHHLVQYVWNVPWSMKADGGTKGLLKRAMADLLPPDTLTRRKSAYPHVQHPDYDAGLLRAARALALDGGSPVAELFDLPRLAGLVEDISRGNAARLSGTMLPGGASLPHMLIQLVEFSEWVKDYGISLR